MTSALAYKPDLDEVLPRLKSFIERRGWDQIYASMAVPSPALADFGWQYQEGFCSYPDPHERAAFWDRHLSYGCDVRDDSLPIAYLSEMDQGLYGGLLGGEVQFMAHPDNGWISSMVSPLLADLAGVANWEGLDGLCFDRSHPWFKRYLRQLDAFVAAASGKFAISHFILINGLNFVFELVGATATYLALDERPELVRRAMELAFEVNMAVQKAFFERVPLVAGGTASNMVEWCPGRIISESVDPFHMTSVAYFEQWGRPALERIYSQFDGGVVHLHGNGRHLLPAVATVKGLKALFLGDDRGYPAAIEVVASLRRQAADLPLVVGVDYATFCDKLAANSLPGGVFYKVIDVPNQDAANRAMDAVRAYRV